jgi:DNA-binding CsgD family transcriptional regulator/tetratricopeptide (TPR) repeat protein
VERWPIVGRDADLRSLRSTVLSQAGGSAAILGPAGIGKTHLAAEVCTEAEQRGFVVLRAIAGENATAFPFAALAPLLPPLGEQRDAAALLQQVRAEWAHEHGARPVVLFIDDCHLLDTGSAALVQQLVSSQACRLLATIRADQPVPEAIDTLWRSGVLDIVDLGPLDADDLHDLLEEILGPPVSLNATRRLLHRTQGNPLFVRELVRAALVDESLTKSTGIWELHAGDTTSMRLADIVRRRIASLSRDAMEVLEVLAVAAAMSESDLAAILAEPPIEDLEERGLIVLGHNGGRSEVRLGHPLFGEVLRADMPHTRARRLRNALAARTEACGARRRDDVLHLVTWLRDSDRSATAEQLVAASKRAQALFDLPLARELASRAKDAGGGTRAAIALAEAEFRSGELPTALMVLQDASEAATSDDEIAGVADTQAHVLCLAGRSDEAFTVLEEARRRVSPDAAEQIAGRAAVLMLQVAGRPREALTAVDELRAPYRGQADSMGVKARMRADYVAGLALPLIGHSDEALRISEAFAEWLALDPDVPIPVEQALIGSTIAHLYAGDLAAAAADAQTVETTMVDLGDPEGEATGALLRGRVAVGQGDLPAARRFFDRALAINEELTDHIGIRWSLGGVALVAGMRGDQATASGAAARLQADTVQPAGLFEPELVQRGLAWAALADGHPTRARELLAAAAREARRLGQIVPAWQLDHDAMRIGGPPAEALLTAAGTPWAEAAALHAHGLTDNNPEQLASAAQRWSDLGFLVEAAETTAAAVDALRHAGANRRATALIARFEELRDACGEARTPGLLRPVEHAVPLTRREKEIADLAIQNLTSATIAERLVLSRRTVENHLQRVYTKLGVSSRAELEESLRGSSDD